jgi:hypothetical protein
MHQNNTITKNCSWVHHDVSTLNVYAPYLRCHSQKYACNVCVHQKYNEKKVTWLYHGFVCGERLECLRVTPEMLHGKTFPTTGGMQK